MERHFSKKILAACVLSAMTFTSAIADQLTITSIKSFADEHSARITIDFNQEPSANDIGIENNFPIINIPINAKSDVLGGINIDSNKIDNLSISELENRVVIAATQYSDLHVEKTIIDNSLVITFREKESLRSITDEEIQLEAREQITSNIADINFSKENTKYVYTIDLNQKDFTFNLEKVRNDLILSFNQSLNNEFLFDKISQLNEVSPDYVNANVRSNRIFFNVHNSKHYVHRVYQVENQLVVEIDVVGKRNQISNYTANTIDINFQDVPIRNVLDIMAEISGKNIVVSDSVAGNMTVRLSNVPWEQALDIVLRSKDLAKRENGNVMLIGTATEILEREQRELEARERANELIPLHSERVQVKFRPASEIKELIEQAEILSERGRLLADDKTNILLINDLRSNINEARKLINDIDLEVNQIMIEAKLITTTTDMARELGVRWGIDHGFSLSGGRFQVGGGAGAVGAGLSSSLTEGGVNSMIDLGVGQAASSVLNIGFLSNNVLLGAELSALQSENKVEILSQPKVITSNGNVARISSGQEVAYQTVENGEVNIEFREVALSLEVKPNIQPGDMVMLDLNINQDSLTPNPFGPELLINKNSIQTIVNVANNETIVLGGVFRKDSESEVRRTPVLSDIPILGQAFRYRAEKETVRELLIFITPRMIPATQRSDK